GRLPVVYISDEKKMCHQSQVIYESKPRQFKRGRDTKIPQSSLVSPLRKVGDEAVHKELGDKMEKAATTASSTEAEQDRGSGPRCQETILGDVDVQTRFETTSNQSIDPPLLKANTFGSGEDSMKILELMDIVHNCRHW
ncbi:hypothetical protein Tco_0297224, partial [Tanacetum coccineum]